MKSDADRRVDEPPGIKWLFRQKLPFKISMAMMDEIAPSVRWFLDCSRHDPNWMVANKLAAYMEVKIKLVGFEFVFEKME